MLSVLIPLSGIVLDPQNGARMQDADAKIRRNTHAADMILVGKVKSVGPPPGAWSGAFAAWQSVDYQVIRLLKKSEKGLPLQAIVVFHMVVSGSKTANTAAPRLRESLFRPGAELILFVREKNSRYEVFDENLGVLPNDPRALEKVEHALTESGGPAQLSR